MLTITYNGQSEALTHVTGYENIEVLNDDLGLSLTSVDVPDNAGHSLVQEDAVITGEDGRDYRIIQVSSTRGRKSVEAISTFYDLGGVVKHEIFGGTKSLQTFLDWTLSGSGWTAVVDGITESALVPNFGGGENALKLIEQLLAAFNCEREILPGNRIRFARQLGGNRDNQFRYAHNVRTLSHNVDISGVRTKITGYGGNGLKVVYTSPNASKFPNAGEQEPFEDERFTVAASLTDRLRQELNDTPDVAIEVEATEVGDVEVGEIVWLIYEPLGIEMETRVIERTNRIPAILSSVVLGNSTRALSTDQLTDTNIRIDDTNATVEENRRQLTTSIEQTNERITLRAEEVDKSLAEITVEAGQIRSYVEEVDNDLNGPGGAWSEIRQQATEISLKVSQEDFNGNNIVSEINQTATTIKIKAQNIELDGITRTNSHLEIGNKDNYQKELRFPLDPYGYAANISATLYGGLSGMSLNASYIGVNAGNELDLAAPGATVNARGDWNFSGTVTGITAVAVLG